MGISCNSKIKKNNNIININNNVINNNTNNFKKYINNNKNYVNNNKNNINNDNINNNTLSYYSFNSFYLIDSNFKNPNLRYKENIINDFLSSYWICETFDIYYPMKNSNGKIEPYIIYPCSKNNDINILRIRDNKSIKSLKGHGKSVYIVKYFYCEKKRLHYLLSAEYDGIVLVWNLNTFTIIHTINTEYKGSINSFLIIFNYDYILTSTDGANSIKDSTKIYSLFSGKFVKIIPNSYKNETLYMINWINNKDYIIELCCEEIILYELLNGKIYHLFKDDKINCKYYSGFISNENKYLYTCSSKGDINIWDLYNKKKIFTITIKNGELFKILSWSIEKNKLNNKIHNYILVTDKKNEGIYCVYINFKKENIDKNNNNNFDINYNIFTLYKNGKVIKSIKKIIHSKYGESLLSSSNDKSIDLWINNNFDI